jgi:hypothetical protein
MQGFFDLPWDLAADVEFFYVDELPAVDVDHRFDLNLRLAWSPIDDAEVSIVGQNLLSHGERQYDTVGVGGRLSTVVQRGVYAKLSWRFE